MNQIRLSPYNKNFPSQGIKTEINGVEMQEVRSIRVVCPVDDIATLHLEQNITDRLDVQVFGRLEPTLVVLDETLEIEVTHPAPGTTRYRAVRRG